jgi:hypothetical protein
MIKPGAIAGRHKKTLGCRKPSKRKFLVRVTLVSLASIIP